MKQLLEISNLSYRIHQKTVLQRVNMELGSGEIAALVGAMGKSLEEWYEDFEQEAEQARG
ncbi:hypothetical protein [Lactobacillus porci]|uniref:Uncharacterized protein n=1 Tax=Lactobacillus porci TaxID=2012477 RepID=A0A6A8MFK7_9LACO|nr:hypothetical protein [Lactobacillus porci]MST87513.1 hypothetical protein [Lactobacillus porci]